MCDEFEFEFQAFLFIFLKVCSVFACFTLLADLYELEQGPKQQHICNPGAQQGCRHVRLAPCSEEGPAEFLYVSMDQGVCFYKIRLLPDNGSGDIELFVNNILVEPDGAATIAHVTGSQHTKSLVRWTPTRSLMRYARQC